MSQPQILTDAFGSVLKPLGFKKSRRDTWHLDREETILIVNLQKSAYSRQYYVNVGIWLKALGSPVKVPPADYQIGCRWENLVPRHQVQYLNRLIDLDDSSLSDDERKSGIGKCLRNAVVPFLTKCESLASLKSFYRSNNWPSHCAVYAVAQDLIAPGTRDSNWQAGSRVEIEIRYPGGKSRKISRPRQ
jgi:hypothetical protein